MKIHLILLITLPSFLFGQWYGMTKVDSNLWVDQTEVTNWEYRKFIEWVRDSNARTILMNAGLKQFKKVPNDLTNHDLNWSTPLDMTDSNIVSILKKSDKYFNAQQRYEKRLYLITDSLMYHYQDGNKTFNLSIYPDTTVWNKSFKMIIDGDSLIHLISFHEPNWYFWHPYYDRHPVVGVNLDQARAYCHWRTKMYQIKYGSSVVFSLPTIDQMLKISNSSTLLSEAPHNIYWGGLGSPYDLAIMHRGMEGEKEHREKLSKYLKKLTSKKDIQKIKKLPDYPYYIVFDRCYMRTPEQSNKCFGFESSFEKGNDKRIYGLAGNVAEMLVDGRVVGGSFLHSLEQCRTDKIMESNANTPEKWLGFRCIMTLKPSVNR